MKTMDAGRTEVEYAAKAGAGVVGVLGAASDSTIKECVEAARNYGCKLIVDMIEVADPVARALRAQELGADYIGIHTAIDQQMRGEAPFDTLRAVAEAVVIPVSAAGGINSETAAAAVEAGAGIVVVGGAITKSADADGRHRRDPPRRGRARLHRDHAVQARRRGRHPHRARPGLDGQRHRRLAPAAEPAGHQAAAAGRAHVRPGRHRAHLRRRLGQAGGGDRRLQARRRARHRRRRRDAGHVGRAGHAQRHGQGPGRPGRRGARSATPPEIARLGFAAFSSKVCANAGEPKGFGEINVPIIIAGQTVRPGDWIVGDDDGVMVLPKEQAVELANRAMDVLEKENRLRGEIDAGKTLAEVAYLQKWEKPR